jgi:hypothetical protein
MKKYFIVWIEGLEYFDGEKIKSFTDTGVNYTTKMTEAIRVKKDGIPEVKAYLKRHGFADWVINGNTFIGTSYAPKGTILNLKRTQLN